MRFFRTLLAATLGVCGACQSSPTAPTGVGQIGAATTAAKTAAPAFLSPAPGAPSIANPVVTFYAKRGETREALMFYHASPGTTDSTVFVRFKVGAKALYARPDGSRFAAGDSVLITLTLADPVALIVDFQPAGLRFDPKDPAELRMSFAETDPDVNGDGAVNQKDTLLTRRFSIWREETATAPWISLRSTLFLSAHEVEAAVDGFTRYAIAY